MERFDSSGKKSIDLGNNIELHNCPFTKEQYEVIQKIIELEIEFAKKQLYYRIIDKCEVQQGVPYYRIKLSRKDLHEIGKELGIEDLRIESIKEEIKNGKIGY